MRHQGFFKASQSRSIFLFQLHQSRRANMHDYKLVLITVKKKVAKAASKCWPGLFLCVEKVDRMSTANFMI